ncbi:MAG: beta strand repeat-containing protein, partial [Terracidiphilus sp.]
TDSASNTGTSSTIALTVNKGLSITSATTLPTGYGNTAYSQTLAASGGSGTGLTWTVTSSPASLTALNLSLSSGGVLSGTPPVAGGSASFGVQVTDSSSNTASATFSLTIDTGVSVTAPSLPPAYPGTAYASSAFAASGGSNAGFTWTMTAASGSSVPAGFSMGSATGIISAASPVNAGATNATYNVVITAADSLGNKGSANATITIEAAASIATGATLPSGTIHIAYSQQLAASGGSGTGYTWSTNGAGTTSLAGLNLTLSAGGLVSGTPATTGSATFAATVTDSESHASAPVTFSVTVYNALTITTTTLPAGDVGSSYSQTLAAGGGFGSGYTWTATASNLSTYGLSLSTAGVVSGTPSQAGTASFTAKVTDSNNNTATQALTITIYGALSLPAPNPSSLPSGYTGVAYTGSVSGSGGSSSVSIAVTSPLSPANGTLAAGISGATVNIAGTPTTAATESFTVQLTDTTTGDMTSQTYSIGISTPVAVSLPTPGSSIPGSATVSQSYASSISASGGVAPYTWSINGTTVTAGGLSLGNGLTAFSTGGSSMSISGTPSSTGTVTLTNVKVVDSLNSNATNTYTIAVNSAGQDITGSVSLSNNCNSSSVPQIALNLYTGSNTSGTPVQSTTTTDSNGDFTFSSVPSGSYTIVPTIAGVSSVFSPASLSITVSSSTVSGQYFAVSLGYTVSGTVAYSGSQAGQVYLALNDNNCGGNGGPGTSITESTLTSGGAFTIRGVPPGSYTLQAWMDPLGQGAQNVNDPTGSTSGLTVSSADLTGQSVALTDPAYATPDTNPQIQVAPNAGGAMIFFQPPVNGNQVEEANQYTVEWSTSPNFTSGPGSAFANVSGSHTFAAIGDGTTVWILNNTVTGANTFTSGTTYYFQARAFNTLAATPSPSGWSTYGGSTPTAVTIGAASCSGTCTTVSGAVTIPAGVTIAAGAPLYLGVFQNTDSGPPNIYAAEIASPVAGGSGNSYSISVPSGSGYVVVGILDQNNNGEIDAGDVTNARNNNSNGVTVSGSTMIGQNVTLPGVNSTATVTTQYYQTISQAGNSSSYQLTLEVDEANKLPVAVTLTSGPNLIHPVDMAICTTCGNLKYQYSATIPGGTPAVGDAYGFTVTYSDGSQETGAIVNGAVTGWNGGASVVDASDAATALAPSGTGSTGTTPTFTWTDSANAMGSNFAYSFYLSQGTGCTGNCTIWQIPGNNSSSNGFSSSITSIAWGVDPTGGGNTPSVGSLTSGDLYYWTIEAQDTNGNQVQTSTWYQP